MNHSQFRNRDQSHFLLGVSLGNKVFTSTFARNLGRYVDSRGISSLRIVLFDRCESVNYVALRGLDRDLADTIARERAIQLRSMFLRSLQGTNSEITVELQSDVEKSLEQLPGVFARLTLAFTLGQTFSNDVRHQVLFNLQKKVGDRGEEFLVSRLDVLSQYIILELAFFYAYRLQYPMGIELYPGTELFVKQRLTQGLYLSEAKLGRILGKWTFEDVSFLQRVDFQPRVA